jgi:hypothetical protein
VRNGAPPAVASSSQGLTHAFGSVTTNAKLALFG